MLFYIVVKKKKGAKTDHWKNYASWYGIERTQEKAEDKALALSPGYKVVHVAYARVPQFLFWALPFFNHTERKL